MKEGSIFFLENSREVIGCSKNFCFYFKDDILSVNYFRKIGVRENRNENSQGNLIGN